MYPKQPALLRSYAQFMQDIKLNPNASMRYYSEADKMDAQLSEVSHFCSEHAVINHCYFLFHLNCCSLALATKTLVLAQHDTASISAEPQRCNDDKD